MRIWAASLVVALAIAIGWVAPRVLLKTTNANEAHGERPISALNTMRNQIELYKIQHADTPPDPVRIEDQMLNATNAAGDIGGRRPTSDSPFGPYSFPSIPQNPHNHQAAIASAPAKNVGWVYTVHGADFTLQAVNTTGTDVRPY
jgi:hypothetical protein